MKRSAAVHVGFVSSLALLACGGDRGPRHCVTGEGDIAPDEACVEQERHGGGGAFHYYYGGQPMANGTRTTMSGGTMGEVAGPSSRGFFGRIGSGFGGAGE